MENVVFTKLTIDDIRNVFREELEDYHRKKPSSKSPVDESADLLTIEDAASFLKLSKNYLYVLIHKRAIPFIKRPGTRRVYFSKAKLITYLTKDKFNPDSESEVIEVLKTRKRQRSK